jgi:transposase
MGGHQADVAEQGARRASWDDRRVLNGICWVLRSGAPWRDLPDCYGPCTTCYNRFVRWRRAGVWGRIMDALAAAHDAAVQMIDTSIVRVHQHAATRYDKLAANYLAFIQLASIRLWLRVYEFTALVQIGCRASRLASPVAL